MSNRSSSPNNQWYMDRLDSMGPHASPLQRERFAVAVDYLERNYTTTTQLPDGTLRESVDRQEVLKQLDSIDFHKEVRLKELKRDDKIYQHSVPGSPTGQYFTCRSTPKDRLGITEGEGSQARIQQAYFVKEERLVVLESHARDTKDTWSRGRQVRDVRSTSSTRVVNADTTSSRTEDGRVIDHHLRRTDDAKVACRVYSNNGDSQGPIEHRSGQYVRGGGVQYHIPRNQHDKLCPAQTPAIKPSLSLTEKPETRTQKI